MHNDNTGIKGVITLRVVGPDGEIKDEQKLHNLITTSGDKYYAQRGANGVAGNADAPTAATGMKLGTGTTAESKSGAASAVVTYKNASNVVFDSAVTSAVGTDVGWKIRYTATWGPGVATDTALTEAVLVNDASTDAASSSANTYARVVFTAVNKGSADTLVLNWDHVLYDAP